MLVSIIVALTVIVLIIGIVLLMQNGNSGSPEVAVPAETPVEQTAEPAPEPTLSISSTLEDEIRQLIFKWDNLNKWGSEDELRFMYADKAKLYGQILSQRQIEEMKREAQYLNDGYSQESNSISMVRVREDLIRCDFTKSTWSTKKGSNEYPSYLYFQRIDGEWLIVEESDKITDANLERRNK